MVVLHPDGTGNGKRWQRERDGRFCVTLKGGAAVGHPAALGACAGTDADRWVASNGHEGLDLTASQSASYTGRVVAPG